MIHEKSHDKLFSMPGTTFVRICGYFQYLFKVLKSFKKRTLDDVIYYCNAESIKEHSSDSNKVSFPRKAFITVKSFSKYQSILLSKIMLRIEANTQLTRYVQVIYCK